ncbi:hypothetical protein H0H87_008795 [Tephrocybe sp. NHM501043]|nr:hypothetical protein H0H87_008795 [Tephrocybe sp. NHM501043]
MKSSRSGLSKGCAVPPSYHAFFSFPVAKSGYSGVSTYVRAASSVPIKAEEGLCRVLEPKLPLTDDEHVSHLGAYPQCILSDSGNEDIDYKDLDSEGRSLVFDFGLFVLINVYCPNDGNGTDERNKYKADFHTVLEARVKGLVEIERREVIVVGDLNACAAIIDHCEGQLMVSRGLAEGLQGEEGFWGKESRRWMRDWMVSEDGTSCGHMIDITRRLSPDRKGMYTCWNTKISARDSNYGTRIDYIMVTRGLLPWVKAADIQPHIKGSDHCPVYLDLYDEIVDATGVKINLQEVMGFKTNPPAEPPRLASKFWNEYSGKQKLLQQFFGKLPATSSMATSNLTSSAELPDHKHSVPESLIARGAIDPPLSASESVGPISSNFSGPSTSSSLPPPPSSTPPATQKSPASKASQSPGAAAVKRKLTVDTLARNSSSKKQKNKPAAKKQPGQATLVSFFAKPNKTQSASSTTTSLVGTPTTGFDTIDSPDVDPGAGVKDSVIDADHHLALLLSAEEAELSQPSADFAIAKQAWSALMTPVQPPKCTVHGEIAKELTVTKPGPNKGKKFFICSRCELLLLQLMSSADMDPLLDQLGQGMTKDARKASESMLTPSGDVIISSGPVRLDDK